VSPARRLAAASLGTTAGLALAAAAAGAAVQVSTRPALRPAFDPAVTDYVARCKPGKPLRVRVNASGADRVSVAGGKSRRGAFEKRVSRAPDRAFTIRQRSVGRTTAYHVRCLPPDFPDWTFGSSGAAHAQWYVVAPNAGGAEGYAAIFDGDGVPVWWWRSTSFGPWDAKLLPDGNLAWTRYYGDHFGIRGRRNAYEVRRLDGSLVRRVRTVGGSTDTHDLQELPNGHYLAITYKPRRHVDLSHDPRGGPSDVTVVDGEIQELTPRGKVVWRWNSGDHIPPSWTTGSSTRGWWFHNTPDSQPGYERMRDLVHLNSVDPDGDGLIVSSRHTDSVFRIDRATGDVDWKLGGKQVPGKSLAVAGAPPGFTGAALFGGQHDARLWKDGSVTVHDNGSWRYRPPVVYRFEIDPLLRTATLVERIANPDVVSSTAIGGARKLSGGNWVVAWGNSPLVTEETEDGKVVRRLALASGFTTYRVAPVEPGELGAPALRRGMNRMTARRVGSG
jgi:hypothetical protein